MVSLLTATPMATGAPAANASGRRQTIAGLLCSSLFSRMAHVHLLIADSRKRPKQFTTHKCSWKGCKWEEADFRRL